MDMNLEKLEKVVEQSVRAILASSSTSKTIHLTMPDGYGTPEVGEAVMQRVRATTVWKLTTWMRHPECPFSTLSFKLI